MTKGAAEHSNSDSTHPCYAMSVDVEEYFQVGAYEGYLSKDDWPSQPHRIEHQLNKLLDLFDETGVKATFFSLGWIAEHHPQLIRSIPARGHELACHGYDHQRVFTFTPDAFRQDVIKAKNLLEDCGGVAVKGYRAPSFSIREDCFWAYDILQDLGFTYSSSLYPVAHDHYGSPTASRTAFYPDGPGSEQGIVEIPPTTLRLLGRNLPVAGGGYFRLFPYALMHRLFDQAGKQLDQPANFYFHPWEIDPDQPQAAPMPAKNKFRHFVNLSKMFSKLERLCQDFHWSTFSTVYSDKLGGGKQ